MSMKIIKYNCPNCGQYREQQVAEVKSLTGDYCVVCRTHMIIEIFEKGVVQVRMNHLVTERISRTITESSNRLYEAYKSLERVPAEKLNSWEAEALQRAKKVCMYILEG